LPVNFVEFERRPTGTVQSHLACQLLEFPQCLGDPKVAQRLLQSARLCCLEVLRCAEKLLHLQRTGQDVLDLVQAALEQGHRKFRPLFDGALHFGSDHIRLVDDSILESKCIVSEDLCPADAFP